MAAAANISLNDYSAVAHTFEPARIDGNFSQYEDRAVGIYIGYNKLTLELIRPKGPRVAGQNQNLKYKLRVETPKLKEESTGSTSSGYTAGPEVDYRLVAEVIVTIPSQASKLERQDLWKFLNEAVERTPCFAPVHDFEMPW